MSPAALGLTCGCVWFGTFLIAQTIIFRWRPGIGRSMVLVRGTAAAACGAMITVGAVLEGRGGEIVLAEVYAVMTVGCIFVLFGPLFYAIHTSLSIESMLILAVKGGSAPLGDLTACFASPRLFDARLETMRANGYLRQDGEYYILTLRAWRVARVFAGLKALWRLGSGG